MNPNFQLCEKRYKNPAIKLYAQAVKSCIGFKPPYKPYLEQFEHNIKRDFVYITVSNDQVVGTISKIPFKDDPSRFESVLDLLYWARTPKVKNKLEHFLKRQPGQTKLVYYQNVLTKDHELIPDGRDVYLSDLVVAEELRRKKIGTALVNYVLNLDNSKMAFSDCYSYGPLAKMFKKTGFLYLLTESPMYPDGSSATFVGKILKKTKT